MSTYLVRAIMQGYTAPRASARWVLQAGNGLETALLMLALAYLIQAILMVLFLTGGFGFAGHMISIIQQLVTFFLFSALIYGIGRLAGGTGTMEGAQLIVGWHALVTSLISPLAIGVSVAALTAGQGGISVGTAMLAFVYVAIAFWLLANYVAELHGFRSAWRVLGAMIGLVVACAFLLLAVVDAFMSA